MTDIATLAQAAEQAGDFVQAATLWQQACERFPDSATAFASAGEALKQCGRLAEARAVLAQALERFSDDEGIAAVHASVVLDMGDLALAQQLWREFRNKFPNNVHGYLGGGLASRRAGHFDDADDLYRAAQDRFPTDLSASKDYAWSAEERGDIPEAIRRWEATHARFPDDADAHVRIGILLRDCGQCGAADAVLQQALERFPDHEGALTAYAWVAAQQGDWPQALKRWEAVIVKFLHSAEARRGAAHALFELGRYTEAVQVLAPALSLFPDDLEVALLNGRLATRRGGLQEAERVWRQIRLRFPDSLEGYRGYALALTEAGRGNEGETILLEAIDRFRGDTSLVVEFALTAERRGDWAAAISRWREVLLNFPDLPEAHVGLGNSLLSAGKVPEAKAVFQASLERWPEDFSVAAAQATALARLREWSTALMRWTALTGQFPANPLAYVGLGQTLRECGEPKRSVQVLKDALARFPGNLELELELALALGEAGDGQHAVAMWESLRQRYPQGHLLAGSAFKMMRKNCREQIGLLDGTEQQPHAQNEDASDGQNLSTLLKGFESLGMDCEFGLVQRIFQADAMGLLRWAEAKPEKLISALEARFAGVGDPENTVVKVVGDEYVSEDTRYGLLSHTFTQPAMLDIEEFTDALCRRIQWLRDKLVRDLNAGRKIFVYKHESLSDSTLLALYAALRRYCPDIALLCVGLQDSERPCGTVMRINGNLFAGYLDRFSTVDISLRSWVGICQSVAAQLSAGARQPKAVSS